MAVVRKEDATIFSLIPPEERGLAPPENFKRRAPPL